MRSYLGFILLIAAVGADVTDKVITTTAKPEARNKRQFIAGNPGIGIPIYFDNFNANPPPLEPLQPIKPVQPVQPLQPITVVTPVVSNTNLQSPGFLPAWSQNLPIVGTLMTNLPLQSLANMLGGLNLGNLGQLGGPFGNLGNLGNLGQLGLGNLPNLGGSKPAAAGGSAPQSCPLTQKLSCHCEPLLSLPERQTESPLLQILKQNVRSNEDGSQEQRLVISNGHVIYHRSDRDAIKQQGYYALPFQTGHYLNIHYSISQTNYTIKADVGSSPPRSDFDVWSGP